jgi:hypothetical protein
MRRREPELFTAQGLRNQSVAQAEAIAAFSIEVRIAKYAFESALEGRGACQDEERLRKYRLMMAHYPLDRFD